MLDCLTANAPSEVSGLMSPTTYKRVFIAAGIYNLAFGAWAGLFPHHYFELLQIDPPRYPSIWACVGMIVGVYGLLYLHAAFHLDQGKPVIAIGLLGKVLGPIGAVISVSRGEFPATMFWLILTNDFIWWVPFGFYLWKYKPTSTAAVR